MARTNIKLFCGNSNPALALDVAKMLDVELSDVTVNKFANKETNVQVHVTVRDEDVFVVQSGCGEGAVNDYCMEVTLRTVFVVLTLQSLLRGPYCVFLTA
eukprot:gene4288-4116_t